MFLLNFLYRWQLEVICSLGSLLKTMSHKLNNSKLRNSQSRKSSLRKIDQRLPKPQSELMKISLDLNKLEVKPRTEEEVAVEVAVAEAVEVKTEAVVVNSEAEAAEVAVEKEEKAKKVNSDQEDVDREEKVKKVNTDQEAVEKEEKVKRAKVLHSEAAEAVAEVVAEAEAKPPKVLKVKKVLLLKERNKLISRAELTTSKAKPMNNGTHSTESQALAEAEVLPRVATVKETGATLRISSSKVKKSVKTKKSRLLKSLLKKVLKLKRLRNQLKKPDQLKKKRKKREV